MQIQLSIASGWTGTEMSVLSRCIGKDGLLKQSRPKGESRYDKWAYYVWRNLMFYLSDIPEHQCMPITCFYELPGDYKARMDQAKALDELVDKVMNLIPPQHWLGLQRWRGLI